MCKTRNSIAIAKIMKVVPRLCCLPRSTALPLPRLHSIQGTDGGTSHRKHNRQISQPDSVLPPLQAKRHCSLLAASLTCLLYTFLLPTVRLLTFYCPSAIGSAHSQSLCNPNVRPSFAPPPRIRVWTLIFYPVIWVVPHGQIAPVLAASSPWIPHFLDHECQQLI